MVTLEEFLEGIIKKFKIIKKVLNFDRVLIYLEEKIFTIDVRKGWKEGIKIIFFEEGDQKLYIVFVDIIFIIKDKLYFYFKRDFDNNIFYIVLVFLRDVLIGYFIVFFVLVFILDNRIVNIFFNLIIKFGVKRRIKGEGLFLFKKFN